MSLHVFANVVTPFGTAANNRGDNEGTNITPLQKLLWLGDTIRPFQPRRSDSLCVGYFTDLKKRTASGTKPFVRTCGKTINSKAGRLRRDTRSSTTTSWGS